MTLTKMNSIKLCLLVAAYCLLTMPNGQADDVRTIEGQVFIRTKGGDNIKLSLVDVLLFDEKTIAEDLEKKRKVAKPIQDYFLPLEKQAKDAEDHAEEVEKGAEKARDKANGGDIYDMANDA